MSNSGTPRNRVLTKPIRTAEGSDASASRAAVSATAAKAPAAAMTTPHFVHIRRFMASYSFVVVPGIAFRMSAPEIIERTGKIQTAQPQQSEPPGLSRRVQTGGEEPRRSPSFVRLLLPDNRSHRIEAGVEAAAR